MTTPLLLVTRLPRATSRTRLACSRASFTEHGVTRERERERERKKGRRGQKDKEEHALGCDRCSNVAIRLTFLLATVRQSRMDMTIFWSDELQLTSVNPRLVVLSPR